MRDGGRQRPQAPSASRALSHDRKHAGTAGAGVPPASGIGPQAEMPERQQVPQGHQPQPTARSDHTVKRQRLSLRRAGQFRSARRPRSKSPPVASPATGRCAGVDRPSLRALPFRGPRRLQPCAHHKPSAHVESVHFGEASPVPPSLNRFRQMVGCAWQVRRDLSGRAAESIQHGRLVIHHRRRPSRMMWTPRHPVGLGAPASTLSEAVPAPGIASGCRTIGRNGNLRDLRKLVTPASFSSPRSCPLSATLQGWVRPRGDDKR